MKRLIFGLFVIPCLSLAISAATYHGRSLDGRVYEASVYSYDASSFYDVTVSFEDDECFIHFPKGGTVTVTLDDEEIDDPHNISAYDFKRSAFWDIDLVSFK